MALSVDSLAEAGVLAPQAGASPRRLHRVAEIPTAHIESGPLLPLTADGFETDSWLALGRPDPWSWRGSRWLESAGGV